jgi:hypothetical protein
MRDCLLRKMMRLEVAVAVVAMELLEAPQLELEVAAVLSCSYRGTEGSCLTRRRSPCTVCHLI